MTDPIAEADATIAKLERRRKWRRVRQWFESGMLLVLVVLYIVGFHTQGEQSDKIAKQQRRSNAQQHKLTVQQRQIIANRIAASLEGCRQRNQDRRNAQEDIDVQIRQTQTLPDKVFEDFNISRSQALRQLRHRKARVPLLDCRRQVAPLRALERRTR